MGTTDSSTRPFPCIQGSRFYSTAERRGPSQPLAETRAFCSRSRPNRMDNGYLSALLRTRRAPFLAELASPTRLPDEVATHTEREREHCRSRPFAQPYAEGRASTSSVAMTAMRIIGGEGSKNVESTRRCISLRCLYLYASLLLPSISLALLVSLLCSLICVLLLPLLLFHNLSLSLSLFVLHCSYVYIYIFLIFFAEFQVVHFSSLVVGVHFCRGTCCTSPRIALRLMRFVKIRYII